MGFTPHSVLVATPHSIYVVTLTPTVLSHTALQQCHLNVRYSSLFYQQKVTLLKQTTALMSRQISN